MGMSEAATMKHPITALLVTIGDGHPFYKPGKKVWVCVTCDLILTPKLAKHAHGFSHTTVKAH